MTWPTGAIETRSHEINDDGSDTVGTIIDAADANWTYDLLERIQVKVGPDSDPDTALSHEGRLKAIEAAIATGGMPNPFTSLGDTLYSDAAGDPLRLGIGTAGQVLTVVAGVPAWAAAATGSAIAAPGDLEYGAATTGAPTALPIGAAFQVLMVQGGLPAWTTAPFIADPAGAPVGATLLKDAAGTWSYAPPATSGYVLTSNGAGAMPTYQVLPATTPGTDIPLPSGLRVGSLLQWTPGGLMDVLLPGAAGLVLTSHGNTNDAAALLTWAVPAAGMSNPMTTPGDTLHGGLGGVPTRLPIGSNGQVYTVVAGAPAWAAATGGAGAPDYATVNWGS